MDYYFGRYSKCNQLFGPFCRNWKGYILSLIIVCFPDLCGESCASYSLLDAKVILLKKKLKK